MTKALFKETLRSIKRTKARFISIIAIVALGISFFAGIKATYPDMHETAVRYYSNNNLMDIWMISTVGFSDDDVKAVNEVAGVKRAAGSKFADGAVSVDGKKVTEMGGSETICRVYGVDIDAANDFIRGNEREDYINRLNLIEGRFPEKTSECLIDRSTLSTPKEFAIGKTITVSGIEESLESQMKTTEFEIVGIIESPRYVSFERGQTTVGTGSLGCFIYVPQDAFSIPFYTELCVTVEGVENSDPYSDEYFKKVSEVGENIKKIEKKCSVITADMVKEYYSKELTEAKKEYSEKEAEMKAQLGDAYTKLQESRQQIENAESELSAAKQRSKKEFEEKYGQLTSGESEYAAGMKEYNAKYDEYLEGEKKIKDSEEKIRSGENQISLLKILIATYKADIKDFGDKITASEEKIANLTKADENYNDQLNEINSKIISENEKIAALRKQIEELPPDPAPVTRGEEEEEPEEETTYSDYSRDEAERELLEKIAVIEAEVSKLSSQKAELQSQKAAGLTQKSQEETNINNWKAQKANAEKKQQEKETTLENAQNMMVAGKAELEAGKNELNKSKKEIDKAKAKLEASGLEIKGGWEAYNKAYSQAQGQIATNSASLQQAKQQLIESSATYSAKEEELYSKLDEARYKIEDSEKKINDAVDINNLHWYINDRNALPGYEGYGQTAENMKAFATVFPLFFFLVAALVCLTTMTRMVDEERTQLGTLKALGYSEIDIQKKYILYAFAASIIGSVIGLAIGLYLYPTAIFKAYGIMYSMPKLTILFPIQYILTGTLAAVLSTLGVTVMACRKEMKTCPATLMRPKAPKAGKRVLLERVPFIWNRLGFTSKVTVRNIFRNKKRFIMTLVGIAGCTALILTGFGLRDSINAIIGAQYGEKGLNRSDCQIAFKNSQTSVDGSKVYQVMQSDPNIKQVMMFYSKSVDGYGKNSDNSLEITLFVPQDKKILNDFVDIQDRRTKEKFTLEDDGTDEKSGVIITEKFAKEMGIKVGENVNLKISEDRVITMKVSAIVENYTYHYAYMSPERYQALFNETPKFNYAYAKYSDEIHSVSNSAKQESARASVASELMKYNDINAVIDMSNVTETFSTMFSSLNSVIYVFVISAAALAFVVLYNLTNININERQREIATLKVLGFHSMESTSYIGRENLAITVMGMIVGIVGGIFLHKFVIEMAEVNIVMFGRTIGGMSFLWSILLTILFSALVSVAMHFRIKKINMIESLKSIE